MARKLGRRRGGRAPSPTGKQGRRIPTGLREGGPQGPPTGWMLLKALGVPDTNATRHAPKMTRMTPRVAHTPSGGGFDGSIATKSMEGVRWRGSSSTFSFLCFFRRDLCFLRGPSPRSGVVSVISFDSMPAAPPPRLQGAQLHIRVAKRVLPQDTSKSRPVARLLLLARRSGPAGCCGALLVSCCARGHTQRHARAVIPGLKSIQIVMVIEGSTGPSLYILMRGQTPIVSIGVVQDITFVVASWASGTGCVCPRLLCVVYASPYG